MKTILELSQTHPILGPYALLAPAEVHNTMLRRHDCAIGAKHLKSHRFSNIIPFDSNLLPTHEYINASMVKLSGSTYIVTQGPMEHTVDAFWQAVGLARVDRIVALTAFDARTCVDYLQERKLAGPWVVQSVLLEVDEILSKSGRKPIYSKHRVELKNKQTGEVKSILHFQYENWPNYSVPIDGELVGLVELMKESNAGWDSENRMLVHCSGGVGRSGAFVSAHAAYRSGQVTQQNIDMELPKIVVELRAQRHPWMIESQEQYEFCRELVMGLL